MANNSNDDDLADRVADIEKCIGDFAEIFAALKDAVNRIPSPDCPPYCSHAIETEYPDAASIEDRVADIRKYVGDTGDVFCALRDALNARSGPDCPPYCAHEIESEG